MELPYFYLLMNVLICYFEFSFFIIYLFPLVSLPIICVIQRLVEEEQFGGAVGDKSNAKVQN